MGSFDRFRRRGKTVPVTIELFGQVLARAAFDAGFKDLVDGKCLADRVMGAAPSIEDSARFRIEMLAFCFLPGDIALVQHHPADAIRVRRAALATMVEVFKVGFALPQGVAFPQQFDAEIPEFIQNRLNSYAEILAQPTPSHGVPPLSRQTYYNISGQSGRVNPIAAMYLTIHFTFSLQGMQEAVHGGDTFADTLARALCVTNPATRVQDARSEIRNPRKPVGSVCRMREGREHLASPRRSLGAGGRRFESGRPDQP